MSVTSLEVLAAALKKFGWEAGPASPGRYDVWRPRDDSDDELVVPVDPTRGDFSALLDRAVDELVRRYGRQAGNVLSLLETSREAGLDETEWKKESPVRGMISWEAGEALYASAREQLLASAKATRQRRMYHGNASAYLAQNFLGESFMGQTDVGSFVISAYTPSERRFHLTKHSEEASKTKPRESEMVSGSTILDTFETALLAVREGLTAYKKRPQIELFLETVEEGVSHEFASALGDFVRHGDAGIKVTRRLFDADHTRIREIEFDAVEAPILDRIATAFVQDREPLVMTLVGEVTDLSRKVKDGAQDRVIRLDVKQGGSGGAVRVRLNVDQYDQAMAVHRAEQWLMVRGLVEREGNFSWIYHPVAIEARERPEDGVDVALWDE